MDNLTKIGRIYGARSSTFRIVGGIWNKNSEAIVVEEKTEEGKNVIVHKFPKIDPKEKGEM